MADPNFLTGLPPDLAAEQAGYATRRAIAQALMQQGMQGPQSYGGRMSPFAGLLSGLQQGLGMYGLMQGAKDEAALGQKMQARTKEELNKYLNTREGSKGSVEMPETPNPEAGWLEGTVTSPAVKADPRRAAIEAIGSGVPMVAQLGMRDISELGKNKFQPKDLVELLRDNTSDSVAKFALTGFTDFSVLQRRPTFHAVGDTPGEYTGSEWKKLGPTLGEQWTEPYKVPGADGQEDVVQRSLKTGQVRKIDNAPRVTVNNDLAGKIDLHAGTKALDQFHKVAEGKMKFAEQARDDLFVLGDALKLYNEGITQGSLQSPRTAIEKFIEMTGWRDPSGKTANTENFMRFMGDRVLKNTRALGPQISNNDVAFLEKIVKGKDITDQEVSDFFDVAMRNNAMAYNAHVGFLDNTKLQGLTDQQKDMYRVPMQFTSPPIPNKPVRTPAPASKPKAAPKIDELLKKYGS
jgi:hypothetical protein